MDAHAEKQLEAIRQQLAHRERELEAARRISEVLFQHLTLDNVIDQALRTAVDVVNAETGSVILVDGESRQLIFRYTLGAKPAPFGTAVPLEKSIAGAVFNSGEPLVIADVKQDARHYPRIDEMTGYCTRDLIALPLKRWEGRTIGVMELLNKREGRLNQDDLAILMIISAFTAIAIEQSWLFQEAKLAEVVRRLGDISHDVENMLMPVLSGAALLQAEVDDLVGRIPEQDRDKALVSQQVCKDIIGMQVNSARRIQERVKEIVDCVKGLSTAPQFAPCQIGGIVDSILEVLRLVAEEKGVALRTRGLQVLPPVIADDRRLFNAFYNLIDNAIAEVPAGGSVTISGEADHGAGAVRLLFSDTGRGMPREVRDSIFTSRTISRKPGGTGLGTKIVKDVVDAHGGEISVESEEGMGTTFFIRLPLSPSKSLVHAS